ncbi:uncharacterized protein [Epargyreus clarus]|uniref:uncharacterized protein n=1 Tax=Epargyreus clarus TaxID=520877 RepID=UPI003C3030E4
MTVWRDYKSRTCSKAAKLRRQRERTGNIPMEIPALTDMERRILSIIGTDYVFGTDCPDSMPENIPPNENDTEITAIAEEFVLPHAIEMEMSSVADTTPAAPTVICYSTSRTSGT